MARLVLAVIILYFTVFSNGSPLPGENADIQSKEQINSQDFDFVGQSVSCLATCLRKLEKQIENTMVKCEKDAECWKEQLGSGIAACMSKCAPPVEQDFMRAAALLDGKSVIPCVVQCLRKSLPDIIAVWGECRGNLSCWVAKIGDKFKECLSQCLQSIERVASIPLDTPTADTPNEESLNTNTEQQLKSDIMDYEGGVNGINLKFIKCVAKCMKTTVHHILRIFLKCRFHPHCYVIELGKDALFCVENCISGLELSPEDAPKYAVFRAPSESRGMKLRLLTSPVETYWFNIGDSDKIGRNKQRPVRM